VHEQRIEPVRPSEGQRRVWAVRRPIDG
jgi:hypothetical protein